MLTVLPHIVDLDDIGMDQRGGRARFLHESLQMNFVSGQGRSQDLNRRRTVQVLVDGVVDIGHATTGNRAFDAIGSDPGARGKIGWLAELFMCSGCARAVLRSSA